MDINSKQCCSAWFCVLLFFLVLCSSTFICTWVQSGQRAERGSESCSEQDTERLTIASKLGKERSKGRRGVMNTGIAIFIALSFSVLCRYCAFYKLKVCGSPASSKSIGAIFPSAFAHFMTLCHILVILI